MKVQGLLHGKRVFYNDQGPTQSIWYYEDKPRDRLRFQHQLQIAEKGPQQQKAAWSKAYDRYPQIKVNANDIASIEPIAQRPDPRGTRHWTWYNQQ